MSPEALVLGLTTVIRPTAVAALIAILSTRSPSRLLLAYVLAGLAFSLAVGALIVTALHGMLTATSSSTPRPVVDLVLGAVALAYAALTWSGRGWSREIRPTSERGSGAGRRLQNLGVRGASAAGVLTHLPGLVYLAALNAIVASSREPADATVQLLVYNALWFSLPATALVMSRRNPVLLRDRLDRLALWTREHKRLLTVVFLAGLGVYLVVSGILALTAAGS